MRLALDAMGGDHAPDSPVQGAVLFAREHPGHEVLLIGDESRVRALLGRDARLSNLHLRHAAEVVEMDEHASRSIRQKAHSSIRLCFEAMKAGEVQAVVSAGHSGAVMAGALLVLGRLEGAERPAFAVLFPALTGGRCLLLDAGANVECKPQHLAQWAVLGSAYVQKVLGVERPRVAVLANGEEDSKGTALTREALALLRRSERLNFLGYCEGKDIFGGEVDVVVTDGFTGNVVLKAVEGTALAVTGLLRQAIGQAGLSERVGALLLKPTLVGMKKVIDYAEYGGAPLLGVDGVGIVAHGRSSANAIKNALVTALRTAEANLHDELRQAISEAAHWLPARRAPRGESHP